MERNEVHIWYVFSECAPDPAWEALLSAEEKARLERFLLTKDRHQHAIARALIRTTLSRYADVPPEKWRFTTNRFGRPEIATPDVGPLRFNLSHTKGLVACIVGWDREIGIDVEFIGRPTRYVELAQRFFAPSEAAVVAALPGEQQREAFFDFWTLKESYIKARGMGLALPLGDFAFQLGEPTTIAFTGSIADNPEGWRFERLQPSALHKLAAAMRCAPEERVRLSVQETSPICRFGQK
jgi:4'-phosphopantetheinyl transferase